MPSLVISYAREDQRAVRQIVKLLRAAFTGIDRAVYWDEDLEPGEEWFAQITRSIDGADQLFVFWCRHSAASVQVRREYEYALRAGKRVVPVLLDHTELVDPLASIHGVDLREPDTHLDISFFMGPGFDWSKGTPHEQRVDHIIASSTFGHILIGEFRRYLSPANETSQTVPVFVVRGFGNGETWRVRGYLDHVDALAHIERCRAHMASRPRTPTALALWREDAPDPEGADTGALCLYVIEVERAEGED